MIAKFLLKHLEYEEPTLNLIREKNVKGEEYSV